jgi:RNA polymerase sigma-70 factor (ECF subfamily)
VKSDRELVQLANQGDPDAFETLYHRYRDWVYRLSWRFTGNQADAMDVLQETFTYLLSKFPGFELTASMTTFLYPAVKHISTAVRTNRRRFLSDDEVLGQLAAPDRESQPDQKRLELSAVLRIVPDEQREILLMRFVDDMSLMEIAVALNLPLGTVKSWIHRALEMLREDRRTRDYFLE